MKSLQQLEECYIRAIRSSDFTTYIHELKLLDVAGYVHFVSTGNITYYSREDTLQVMKRRKGLMRTSGFAERSKIERIVNNHFAGELNYEDYCSALASAGVYKWIVDIDSMTLSYYSGSHVMLSRDLQRIMNSGVSEKES